MVIYLLKQLHRVMPIMPNESDVLCTDLGPLKWRKMQAVTGLDA